MKSWLWLWQGGYPEFFANQPDKLLQAAHSTLGNLALWNSRFGAGLALVNAFRKRQQLVIDGARNKHATGATVRQHDGWISLGWDMCKGHNYSRNLWCSQVSGSSSVCAIKSLLKYLASLLMHSHLYNPVSAV